MNNESRKIRATSSSAPRRRSLPHRPRPAATKDIAAAMNGILADVFALYMKTRTSLAHERPHFRDYHLLLDEQADQLYAMTDPLRSASARSAEPR